MAAISRDSLLTLEAYSRQRSAFRARVIEHKKKRLLALGPSVTLVFEDELSIRYQVQEMLRIERIFEDAAIEEELAAYLPLVPDGNNLKATMMIEFPDPLERAEWLGRLIGIEDRTWLAVSGHEPVFAIADEDLERENAQKTSAVHFLRFEFDAAMIGDLKQGATLAAGIDLENYRVMLEAVPEPLRLALIEDFKT